MVFKLPSARCLSKASRDGALSENMANADINASLKGISTSSTRSSAMVAKCSRSKRKSASAQRYLRPFGTTMDIATLNLTSSTCEIVPMRAVLWHACLRKARWDTGVVTRIYRPPGIAGHLTKILRSYVGHFYPNLAEVGKEILKEGAWLEYAVARRFVQCSGRVTALSLKNDVRSGS